MTKIIYSQSVLSSLSEIVESGKPLITSERGDLFFAPRYGLGAIRLKISPTEYFRFVDGVEFDKRPRANWIIEINNQVFQIVVDVSSLIEFKDGKSFVDGKEIIFI